MFSIFYFIVILFMCLILPFTMMIAPVVGAINTGGSPVYIIGMLSFFVVGVIVVSIIYKRIKSSPQESKEEVSNLKWMDDLKKMRIEATMGGEGAKATVEVSEEIVTQKSDLTDFEKEAIKNSKNLGMTGDIDWTISTVETNGERNKEYDAKMSAKDNSIIKVRKANNLAQTIFKILGLIVLVVVEVLLVLGSIRQVFIFSPISIYNTKINSIQQVVGYYVDSDSYSCSSSQYRDELSMSCSYNYVTNKKTDEIAKKYQDYLESNFNYNDYEDFYYKKDPNNSEYIYKITISKGDKYVYLSYYYEAKPYWLY